MSRPKKKAPLWWPGKYEGKAPGEVLGEIGTAAALIKHAESATPSSMRAFNPKTGALRRDGKLCQSLNGLD